MDELRDAPPKVNQIAELHVDLWTAVLSPGTGTLTWATTFDDLAALEASDDKLNADAGYQMLAEEGARLLTAEGINDALMRFVTPVAEPAAGAPQPNYVWVVTATLAQGAMVNGIEVGVKIAEAGTKASGTPVAFATDMTGVYGQVRWISLYENVAQYQRAQEAINSDATVIQLIDGEASKVYQPTATQMVNRRIM